LLLFLYEIFRCFLLLEALQRLGNIAVIKSQTYSQYTLVFNKDRKDIQIYFKKQTSKNQSFKNHKTLPTGVKYRI